jgi:hypothetical protein
MRKPLTMEDAEALKNLPSIETAVSFLDITNNFFGQKLLVSGKNGKLLPACGSKAQRRTLKKQTP